MQIRGRVIDAESGTPITGAVVFIHPDNIKEHKNPYYPNQTISGQNGQFNFEGVPPGKHYINVSVPEETSELVDKRVKFDVQANQEIKEITVALDKGGLIKIIAREEGTNKPVSNLPIHFWQAIQDEHSNFYKYAITGKEGRLQIWAPPGECKLSVRYDRYLNRGLIKTPEDQVIVIKGQTVKSEIILDRTLSVSGVVLDESGQPLAGVIVKRWQVGEEVFTDEVGRFEIGFYPTKPCERLLIARHIGRNLAAIVEVKDYSKPIQIKLKPALSIVGRVINPEGVGIPAARLLLYAQMYNTLWTLGPEALTDAQGRYEIKAIPPEASVYRISINASGYGFKRYERIFIKGEPGTTVDTKTIVLQPAARSISGLVVDVEGKPAARVPILMRGNNQPVRYTATDKDGRFTIKRVCKGPIRLQANFANQPRAHGFIKTEGGDENVKIVLDQRGGVCAKQPSLPGEAKQYRDGLSGMEAPAFPQNATWLNSKPLTWKDLWGKVVILDFWACWCVPCRKDLPVMRDLHKKREETGIIVIGVHTPGSKIEDIKKHIKKYDLGYPICIDTSKPAGAKGFGMMSSEYGEDGIPYAVVINPEGEVAVCAETGCGVESILKHAIELAGRDRKDYEIQDKSEKN